MVRTLICWERKKEDRVNNNKNKELEREIMFLRSYIDYFYANGVYPFAFRCATEDFCTDYIPEPLSPEEYLAENEMLWNRYKKRVWKICKKLETLEDPREQQRASPVSQTSTTTIEPHLQVRSFFSDSSSLFRVQALMRCLSPMCDISVAFASFGRDLGSCLLFRRDKFSDDISDLLWRG